MNTLLLSSFDDLFKMAALKQEKKEDLSTHDQGFHNLTPLAHC